jgi:hypothetical protein
LVWEVVLVSRPPDLPNGSRIVGHDDGCDGSSRSVEETETAMQLLSLGQEERKGWRFITGPVDCQCPAERDDRQELTPGSGDLIGERTDPAEVGEAISTWPLVQENEHETAAQVEATRLDAPPTQILEGKIDDPVTDSDHRVGHRWK